LKSDERERNAAISSKGMCEKRGKQIKIPKKKRPSKTTIRSCRICYGLSNAKPLNETEGMDIEDKVLRKWYL
jgi:hypothetical protein